MAESWVINASPVILLAKVGLIQLVPQLARPLVIPFPVAEEIRQGRTHDPAVVWLGDPGREFLRPAVPELPALQTARIGPGERSVLSWDAGYPGFVAILDDAGARSLARAHGIPICGTVGVIMKLKHAGLISAVKPHLLSFRDAGGYLGDRFFRAALQQAGEIP